MAKIDQRYQGSFTLQALPGKGGELVRGIQAIILDWIRRSEWRLYGKDGCCPNQNFLEGGSFASKRPRVSNVVSSSYYGESDAAWCMCYTHDDSMTKGVDWVTECGLRFDRTTDRIVVSVMLTTSTTGEVLLKTEERPEWNVSVPGFVRTIFEHAMIKSVSISQLELPLSADLRDERRRDKKTQPWLNWVKTEDDARHVRNIIDDPSRRFAVALVMGESPHAKNEALDLASGLCGKSYVCLVKYDRKVFQYFDGYDVPFDRVRVLLPFHRKEDISRHPQYAISANLTQKEERERIIESQIGYVTVFESDALYRQQDIASLNRFASNKKKGEEFKRVVEAKNISDKDAREMLAYAESVQKDFEQQKNRADTLEQDRDEWKTLAAATEEECRQKLLSQKAAFEGQLRKRKADCAIPETFPNSVLLLKPWVSLLRNLEIDEGAWRGMEDRDNPEKVTLAWNMLWHLNTTMHKIIFEEAGLGEPRKIFKERSGYTYTADENDDVKKKWPEGHKAVINNTTFMCWRHIKRGNDNKELVRVYFDFDMDQSKIVISWIGRHLRTNLTSAQ